MITKEQEHEIIRLRCTRLGLRKIAEQLGLSVDTVQKYANQNKPAIDAEMIARDEELFQSMKILREDRIRDLTARRDALQAVLTPEAYQSLPAKDTLRALLDVEKRIADELGGSKRISKRNVSADLKHGIQTVDEFYDQDP